MAGYVVAARRTDAPWARSYAAFVKLGLAVLVVRLAFAVFLGSPIPGTHVLVTLPEVPLPALGTGHPLGGRVTAEGLLFALYDGLKLATLLVCVGAANALANPARLLKSLPGRAVRGGRRGGRRAHLRAAPDRRRPAAARRPPAPRPPRPRGLRGLLQVGLPVLEGALERSVALAAAMDARGYGRTARSRPPSAATTGALTLGGLLGVCAGTYGLLDRGGRQLRPARPAGRARRGARAACGWAAAARRGPGTGPTAGASGPGWSPVPGAAVAALMIVGRVHRPRRPCTPAWSPLVAPALPLLAGGGGPARPAPRLRWPRPPSGPRPEESS